MYGNAVKQSIRVDCSLRGRHLLGLTPPTGTTCTPALRFAPTPAGALRAVGNGWPARMLGHVTLFNAPRPGRPFPLTRVGPLPV